MMIEESRSTSRWRILDTVLRIRFSAVAGGAWYQTEDAPRHTSGTSQLRTAITGACSGESVPSAVAAHTYDDVVTAVCSFSRRLIPFGLCITASIAPVIIMMAPPS